MVLKSRESILLSTLPAFAISSNVRGMLFSLHAAYKEAGEWGMVSPYLMRPVRRLEDVLKGADKAPGTIEAAAVVARRHRAPGNEHAGTAAAQHRPRVVWVNERLSKGRRKPGGGSGTG